MKSLRLALVALLAVMLAPTVFAQTETTTLDGISLDHPAGFIAEEISPGTIAISDATDTYGVIILTSAAFADLGFPVDATPEDILLIDNAGLFTVTSIPAPVSLPSGEGIVAKADITDFGPGHIIVVDGAYGMLIAFVAGEFPAGFEDTALEIVGSVVIAADASLETVPTEVPLDVTPNGPVALDGTTCPIPVSALPENTIIFCDGVVMTLPDAWVISDGITEIDNFASSNRNQYGVTLSTTISEISPYYNPAYYIAEILPINAEIAEHADFDPAEHVQTTEQSVERTIQYYDPAEFVELDKDDVRQVTFIVTLNNDLFVTHIFTWIPALVTEGVEDDLAAIVDSTTLADFYAGVPAMIELNGETVFVGEASGGESTYGFRFNDETTFVVACPVGLTANEGAVWGTEIYTSDSSVCHAAAHAGVTTLEDGGFVVVTMLPGQDSYVGSTANGVTTSDYGTWGDSFSVAPLE